MINQEELRNTIIKELRIEQMPQEAQNMIIAKLGENIIKRISIAIFDRVPQERHSELDELSETQNQEGLRTLLNEYIPNVDSFVQEQVQKTITELKQIQENS